MLRSTLFRAAAPLSHRSHGLGPLAGARRLATGDKAEQKPEASLSSDAEARKEAYNQLQNLDFMTAAKMLFTATPNRKKFGLDFHLVQLFFACLPSLAVYLVAQYARYEIRRMEAEVEAKKKAEEEKAKEAELRADEGPEVELSKVKHRLDALEEVVKDIVIEKNKITTSSFSKDQEVEKKDGSVPGGSKSSPQSPLKAEKSRSSKDVVSASGSPGNIASKATSRKESSIKTDETSSAPTKK